MVWQLPVQHWASVSQASIWSMHVPVPGWHSCWTQKLEQQSLPLVQME